MNKYYDCYDCGSDVKEINTSREIWWKGKLYLFEKVPMGMCLQCGEKILKPAAAKETDLFMQEKSFNLDHETSGNFRKNI